MTPEGGPARDGLLPDTGAPGAGGEAHAEVRRLEARVAELESQAAVLGRRLDELADRATDRLCLIEERLRLAIAPRQAL